MSQLASAGTARPLEHSVEWWKLTIKPAKRGSSEAVIAHIVTPLSAQAGNWGVERWSYSRHLAAGGESVQYRALATRPVLERLHPFALALAELSAPQLGEVHLAERFCGPAPSHRNSGQVSLRYEAALAKYGGVEGLALAAEVCEMGSDLALWANSVFDDVNRRSALGALLLHDACDAMRHGPRASLWPDRRAASWDYYWDAHLRSTTASFGSEGARQRTALTTQVAARILPMHRLMAATASDPSVANWRRRWMKALDTYLYRADKNRVSRSALHLTMYHSAQLLNRMGMALLDQAALGLYARTWSRQREAVLVDGPAASRTDRH